MRLKTFLGWSGAKKDIKETPKVEETQTAGFFKSVVVVVAAVVAGGNNVVVVEADSDFVFHPPFLKRKLELKIWPEDDSAKNLFFRRKNSGAIRFREMAVTLRNEVVFEQNVEKSL